MKTSANQDPETKDSDRHHHPAHFTRPPAGGRRRGAEFIGPLVAAALCFLPTPGRAALSPATASGVGVDDNNTSTLTPNTVNGGNNTPTFYTAQCPWITTTMNAFVAANPAYSWAWAVPTFNLQSDLTVSDYSAWVVTSPNTANGFPLTGGVAGADAGGADFGLTYTPTAMNSPQNIFFIQAYQEILYPGYGSAGATTNVKLDNLGKATPWYGGASSYTAAVSKMGDEPADEEPEGQEGYHTDVEFQTVVAVDNGAGPAGSGITDSLTLYQGAEWWGYLYSNVEVPEPATLFPAALLLLFGVSTRRTLRRRKA
jgi:hypothetical protein